MLFTSQGHLNFICFDIWVTKTKMCVANYVPKCQISSGQYGPIFVQQIHWFLHIVIISHRNRLTCMHVIPQVNPGFFVKCGTHINVATYVTVTGNA